MSWYKAGSDKIQVEKTPTKDNGYIQVPSSSPVNKSSPAARALETLKPELDEQALKALESRRQAIRNHKDFPLIRQRFSYLPESDIFKGFVKGRGNLRDVTKWLTDNFNREDILSKQRQQEQEAQQREEDAKRVENTQRLMKEYELHERREKEAEEARQAEIERRKRSASEINEDEESPIKVRGKSRLKTVDSPVRSQESQSTKVELTRPKMSILDKYRMQRQPSIMDMMKPNKVEQPKKKLVRLSSIHGTNKATPATSISSSPEPDTKPTLSSFKYYDGSKFKSSLDKKSPVKDDLDALEDKIRQNRKNKKSNSPQVFDDDDISDDMSGEEEYVENNGFTTMDSRILEFLNNASLQDIVEIGNVPPKVSEVIVSMRPFDNIYKVIEDHFDLAEEEEETKTTSKRKKARKPLGQKLVETIETNLKGYRAVDSLVKKCSEVGSLVSKQMEAWGVTETGQDGELEMVDLKPTQEVIEIDDAEDDEDDEIQVVKEHKKVLKYIHEAPENFSEEFELKNYQVVGINWLNLLYTSHFSCILADEMGLGKTCQVIAFMAHLKATSSKAGPHLVVVPSSTLENWLREFSKFCPDLVVQAYYGSQAEREELRYELREAEYDVMVTTYNLAAGSSNDTKFLKHQNFDIVVYDEGHMLKNSNSERYNKLMKLNAKFRLLLTGTPLQNNLKELVSLLAFMLPHLFTEKKEDLQIIFNQKISTNHSEGYNPLLSTQAISKAKTMMTPFVLRRKKAQVLSHLPKKLHKTEFSELTPTQRELYDKHLNEGKANRKERERRKQLTGKEAEEVKKLPILSSSNVLMLLRKAALHPLLFRRLFTDAMLKEMSKKITKEPEYADANSVYIHEDMEVMTDFELDRLCKKFPVTLGKYQLDPKEYLNSGKITPMVTNIKESMQKNEKVLIFSLFTQVLDILETVLSSYKIKFLRLDGSTSVENRQDLIDTFYEDETIPVFLLSTKAGGFGINLVAANNVIIYDQSFNPHDDKQAEDRAHRVGQTKEVTVTRLIAKNTVEENILQLAESKLQLDQSISTDTNENVIEEKTANLFEKLLFDQ